MVFNKSEFNLYTINILRENVIYAESVYTIGVR